MRSWTIWFFFSARVFSTIGDQLLQFAVPLIVYDATRSVSMAGLAFLIEWLPRLSSLPLAGFLSDRFGGRRVYATSDSVRAGACLLTALALGYWPGRTFALTAALMALCAFCYAQTFIALESTVPQMVAKEDYPRAQRVLEIINSGSGVFGPALGGALLIWVQAVQLLWVSGAAFAVAALGVIAVRGFGAPASRLAEARVSVLRDLRVSMRSLAANSVLLSLVGLTVVVNLMVGLATATGAALTVGYFRQEQSAFASLQVTVGALAISTLLLLPWLMRRVSIYRIGTISFLLSAIGAALIGVAHFFPLYVLGYGLCIGLCGLFNVFIRVERLHWIAVGERGRVISLIVLLNQSTMPLAGLLVAVVGTGLRIQTLLLAVAAVAAVVYVLLFRPLQRQAITARSAAIGLPLDRVH
jgi:hypothetical protein